MGYAPFHFQVFEQAMNESKGFGHWASDIAGLAIYLPAYAGTKFCCLVAEAQCAQTTCPGSFNRVEPMTA